MSTDEEELNSDEGVFLAAVPDGDTISNPALQSTLGWDTERYFAVRDRLEDQGLIARGRGRGGTVRKVSADEPGPVVTVPAEDVETPEDVQAVIQRETDLYEPMRDVIRHDWARDRRAEPLSVGITTQQGRRETGGIWSRPDIVSVEVRTFPWVPGKFIELETFEIKPHTAITVQAVYEALAHRRSATRSYVLLHVPVELESELESSVADVAELARLHGIGVVVAADPGDYKTWEEREAATRVEPDPERLNSFIATQVPASARDGIARRLR